MSKWELRTKKSLKLRRRTAKGISAKPRDEKGLSGGIGDQMYRLLG